MTWFPLPADYFAPVTLAEEELASLRSWSESILRNAIEESHEDQSKTEDDREQQWKALKRKGNMTSYRMRSENSTDANSLYMCRGTMQGTIDRLSFGQYADTTETFRQLNAIQFDNLVDCAILHVIESQSLDKPFFFSGFKWACAQFPGTGVIRNRDACYFEQSGIFIDQNGEELGYVMRESMAFPNCPVFDPSICVRSHYSAWYVYRQKKNETVQVYMRAKLAPNGHMMDWVTAIKSADVCFNMEKADIGAQARIATCLIEAAAQNPREKQSMYNRTNGDLCDACRKRTKGFLTSKKCCKICHRVICLRCHASVRVLGPVQKFTEVIKEDFCKSCTRLLHMKNIRQNSWATVLRERISTSHTSELSSQSDNRTDEYNFI